MAANPRAEISQTLDRGLRVLEAVAAAPNGCTPAELMAALELNRTVVYRLLATLAAHRLVARDETGRYRPATGLVELAKRFSPRLHEIAGPHLRALAEATGATSHLTIADASEAVAIAVAEPSSTSFHVAYRIGSRHSLDVGAAGIAILAGLPASDGDTAAVRRARDQGYALTRGELEPGAIGIAAPLRIDGHAEAASIGIVTYTEAAVKAAVPAVIEAARTIRAAHAGGRDH